MSKQRTGILVILDGFGINPDHRFNAIALAKMPTFDRLLSQYPHGEIQASESHVGLPSGFMGNSEVGHLNIGSGRVVRQDFSLISCAIEDGSFFKNRALGELFSVVKKKDKALHLLGLLSDGGVHSHLSHLLAVIQMAVRFGLRKVFIHAFTDGRDTSPTSGRQFVKTLLDFIHDSRVGSIATVMGRYYAMDRDNRWDRIHLAYQAIVGAEGESFTNAMEYVERHHQQGTTDEFLPPGVDKHYPGFSDGDGVFFFNFRADRARQLTRAITQSQFTYFQREKLTALASFVTMTPYDETFNLSSAFEKVKVRSTLGELVSQKGWKQLRIAETEKYAHVTYFFNGGEEKVFEGEKRILIPSPKEVKTYDLKPQMSALEVTDALLTELKRESYGFVVVNFANPDMVGHTGNIRATVEGVEAVDRCLSRIVKWVESEGAFAVITADHGNCEMMRDPLGLPMTAHTLFPVPLIVVDPKRKGIKVKQGGSLCDLAPTFLALWGIDTPTEMTGKSLVEGL